MLDSWPNWAIYLCWLALALGICVLLLILSARFRRTHTPGLPLLTCATSALRELGVEPGDHVKIGTQVYQVVEFRGHVVELSEVSPREAELDRLRTESQLMVAKLLHPSNPHWLDVALEELRDLGCVPYDWQRDGE